MLVLKTGIAAELTQVVWSWIGSNGQHLPWQKAPYLDVGVLCVVVLLVTRCDALLQHDLRVAESRQTLVKFVYESLLLLLLLLLLQQIVRRFNAGNTHSPLQSESFIIIVTEA
jgi:hypothetical protein